MTQEIRGEQSPEITANVFKYLMEYNWPGNVRELKNLAQRLTLSCQCDPITPDCLPVEIRRGPTVALPNFNEPILLDSTMANYEKALIIQALEKTAGNKAKAASLLGVPATTLKSKIQKYGL